MNQIGLEGCSNSPGILALAVYVLMPTISSTPTLARYSRSSLVRTLLSIINSTSTLVVSFGTCDSAQSLLQAILQMAIAARSSISTAVITSKAAAELTITATCYDRRFMYQMDRTSNRLTLMTISTG